DAAGIGPRHAGRARLFNRAAAERRPRLHVLPAPEREPAQGGAHGEPRPGAHQKTAPRDAATARVFCRAHNLPPKDPWRWLGTAFGFWMTDRVKIQKRCRATALQKYHRGSEGLGQIENEAIERGRWPKSPFAPRKGAHSRSERRHSLLLRVE